MKWEDFGDLTLDRRSLQVSSMETLGLSAEAAREEDWPKLAMTLEAAHHLYSPMMGDAFLKLAQKYRESGPPNPENYWCIYWKSDYVGFLAYEVLGPTDAYLIGLYLLPEFRGLHLGSTMLLRLEGLLAALGIHNLWLQVHEAAPWARGFYEAIGFTETTQVGAVLGARTLTKTRVMKKEVTRW